MVFLGTYEHSIDDKNRLVLPSKIVLKLSKTVFISKGFDGCLEIREKEDFNDYVKKLLSYSNTSKDARQVQRIFLSLSCETEIDSAKRILIPSNLRNKANLTKDVVIIGVGKMIEI
jgi:MraZ protein